MVFQKGSFWGFSVHIISEQTSKDKSILLCRSHPSPCPRNKSVSMAQRTHTLKWMHFFTEESTSTTFQKEGINTVSHSARQLVPEAGASHQPIFTFYTYRGVEWGLILDTVPWKKYFEPTEHPAQCPEIQALFCHLGKSKYTSRKETSAFGPKDMEIPRDTTPQLTTPQQLDTCAMSQDYRAPTSRAQNIPTPGPLQTPVKEVNN